MEVYYTAFVMHMNGCASVIHVENCRHLQQQNSADQFHQYMMQVATLTREEHDVPAGVRDGIPYLTKNKWPDFFSKCRAIVKPKNANMHTNNERIDDQVCSNDEFAPPKKEAAG